MTVLWSKRATEFDASLTAPRQLRFPVLVKSPWKNSGVSHKAILERAKTHFESRGSSVLQTARQQPCAHS